MHFGVEPCHGSSHQQCHVFFLPHEKPPPPVKLIVPAGFMHGVHNAAQLFALNCLHIFVVVYLCLLFVQLSGAESFSVVGIFLLDVSFQSECHR